MTDVDYGKILNNAAGEFRIEPPTYDQRRFAEGISQCLQIDLPKEYTKAAYTKFISTYHAEYYLTGFYNWDNESLNG